MNQCNVDGKITQAYAFELQKQKANYTVRKLLQQGTLQMKPCSVCGVTENILMHHEDYNEPANVIFLCRSCHIKRHMQIRKELKA